MKKKKFWALSWEMEHADIMNTHFRVYPEFKPGCDICFEMNILEDEEHVDPTAIASPLTGTLDGQDDAA